MIQLAVICAQTDAFQFSEHGNFRFVLVCKPERMSEIRYRRPFENAHDRIIYLDFASQSNLDAFDLGANALFG